MPRAENRKKQANQLGSKNQGGFHNKQSIDSTGTAFGQAKTKKQELIEKMKKQLEKNTEA